MPYKQKHPCNYVGCSNTTTERYCSKHKAIIHKAIDSNRPNSSQRGYDSKWRRDRKMYLTDNPLCVECLKIGKLVTATVVDHIIPHKGNYELFSDVSNWQALCKHHHDSKTMKELRELRKVDNN